MHRTAVATLLIAGALAFAGSDSPLAAQQKKDIPVTSAAHGSYDWCWTNHWCNHDGMLPGWVCRMFPWLCYGNNTWKGSAADAARISLEQLPTTEAARRVSVRYQTILEDSRRLDPTGAIQAPAMADAERELVMLLGGATAPEKSALAAALGAGDPAGPTRAVRLLTALQRLADEDGDLRAAVLAYNEYVDGAGEPVLREPPEALLVIRSFLAALAQEAESREHAG